MTSADKARESRLKREYHITLAEYEAALSYQKHRCAICKRPVTDFKTRLAIDHRHLDGLLRGLLCWHCNRAIGGFRDSIEKMAAAVEYLTNPPFTVTLGKSRYSAPGKVGSKKRAKLLLKMKQKEKV